MVLVAGADGGGSYEAGLLPFPSTPHMGEITSINIPPLLIIKMTIEVSIARLQPALMPSRGRNFHLTQRFHGLRPST